MKKRILAMLVAIVLVLSVLPVQALAARDNTFYADELHALGLFDGMGKNPDGTPIYNLEGSLTRAQAFVMLTRLLGEEKAALAYTGSHPFTDCANHWASKEGYIGYCYSMGYLEGMTPTTCEPETLCNAKMFLTLLLRALGYTESVDFKYDTAYLTAAEAGIIDHGEYSKGGEFLRGDLVYTSYMALSACIIDTDAPLIRALVLSGAVDKSAAIDAGLISAGAWVVTDYFGCAYDKYFYDANDSLTRLISYDCDGVEYYRVDYKYDAGGKLTEETDSDGYRWVYTYDSEGRKSKTTTYYNGELTGSSQYYYYLDGSGYNINYYDEYGVLWSKDEYDADGVWVWEHYYGEGYTESYKYDEYGNTIEYYYYENGALVRYGVYEYHADGRYDVCYYEADGFLWSKDICDEYGWLLWEYYYNRDGSSEVYNYGDNGYVAYKYFYDATGKLESYVDYYYDEYGTMTRETCHAADGTLIYDNVY